MAAEAAGAAEEGGGSCAGSSSSCVITIGKNRDIPLKRSAENVNELINIFEKSIINDLEIELFKHRCLNQKVTSKKLSKKQELLSSLEYLKNKKVKTKQDQDSIYIIEMVLKSM